MKYGDWTVRSFRMAVCSRYPTPYCAVAERRVGPEKLEVFNTEGETVEEAERLARERIDEDMNFGPQKQPATVERIMAQHKQIIKVLGAEK